jgi:hypothetical protein
MKPGSRSSAPTPGRHSAMHEICWGTRLLPLDGVLCLLCKVFSVTAMYFAVACIYTVQYSKFFAVMQTSFHRTFCIGSDSLAVAHRCVCWILLITSLVKKLTILREVKLLAPQWKVWFLPAMTLALLNTVPPLSTWSLNSGSRRPTPTPTIRLPCITSTPVKKSYVVLRRTKGGQGHASRVGESYSMQVMSGGTRLI